MLYQTSEEIYFLTGNHSQNGDIVLNEQIVHFVGTVGYGKKMKRQSPVLTAEGLFIHLTNYKNEKRNKIMFIVFQYFIFNINNVII
jgi:hypothetical protein